jgi:hypothetical protein
MSTTTDFKFDKPLPKSAGCTFTGAMIPGGAGTWANSGMATISATQVEFTKNTVSYGEVI